MYRHVKKLWTHDVGLTILLVVLLAQVFVLYPLVESEVARIVLINFSFILVLISGVLTVVGTPIWGGAIIGLAIISVILRIIQCIHHAVWLESTNVIFGALFACVLMGVILSHVFREGPINFHRIAGAVALYMLLGILFAMVFTLIDFQDPTSFSMAPHLESRNPHILGANFVYFSFVTLTSVGFGDILPVHPVAKTTVILESMVGQLFPAILIARLVAMEIEDSRKRHAEDSKFTGSDPVN